MAGAAHRRVPLETIRPKSSWLARSASRTSVGSGGGGNRTRVRGRTGQSVYKLRQPFAFARRPVGCRPTDGLAILRCRALGDWLSLGAEPVSWRRCPSHGPSSERRRYLVFRLGGECEIVLRTCFVSRLINEADRGPRLAALPENRPRRNLIAPVCVLQPYCSRVLEMRPIDAD